MSIDDKFQEYEQLIQLIRDTIQQDVDLRTKYGVADKFRFVRDRLQGLLTHLEEQANTLKVAEQNTQAEENPSDKTTAYVYLYNAQGALLRTWLTLLTPRVFYEYSINRPIYHDKNFIDSFIRTKTNKQQHGYLTIQIRQSDITSNTENAPKDSLGNALIKIREGSLNYQNLITFTHNEQDYIINAQGEFVKKT